jgi:hypothetical protein
VAGDTYKYMSPQEGAMAFRRIETWRLSRTELADRSRKAERAESRGWAAVAPLGFVSALHSRTIPRMVRRWSG